MKRIVTMQDLSCLGKCSLTVAQPVLSAMGCACSVLPTAVLSTHTAFPAPAVTDLTGFIHPALDHWQSIGAEFDGILTGYLADPAQAELALELVERFGERAFHIHDPAMGDHGKLYAGMSLDMVFAHRQLCMRAGLIVPNLTEGMLLGGVLWQDRTDLDFCKHVAAEVLKISARAVLLTGYSPQPDQVGFYYTNGTTEFAYAGPKLPRNCHGTGDLFTAALMGGLMNGLPDSDAGKLAAEFVHRAIAKTGEDSRFGVAFEEELGWLAAQCRMHNEKNQP